jgi:hypothetical protein
MSRTATPTTRVRRPDVLARLPPTDATEVGAALCVASNPGRTVGSGVGDPAASVPGWDGDGRPGCGVGCARRATGVGVADRNLTGATGEADLEGDGDRAGGDAGGADGDGARLTPATTVIVPDPLGKVETGLTSVTVSTRSPACLAW